MIEATVFYKYPLIMKRPFKQSFFSKTKYIYVFMIKEGEGTVILDETGSEDVAGTYRTDWQESQFKPMPNDEHITLKNIVEKLNDA